MAFKRVEPPPLSEPLTAHVVDDEVVLDGAMPSPVSLTCDAALETGIELLNAALDIDIAKAREADRES